jgi:hypothetical protein
MGIMNIQKIMSLSNEILKFCDDDLSFENLGISSSSLGSVIVYTVK